MGGKGPGKERDKVQILLGVLGTLKGGYGGLQHTGSGLCGSGQEVPGLREVSTGSPQATFLVVLSSPVGPSS